MQFSIYAGANATAANPAPAAGALRSGSCSGTGITTIATDVVLTGTPEGVALSGRFPYLVPGDVVRLEIDGLGSQTQRMVGGEMRESGTEPGSGT